jgi:transposase
LARAAETEQELAIVSQQGPRAGMTASLQTDAAISGNVRTWVNDVRSLFRPTLTVGLVALCYVVFHDLMNALANRDSLLAPILAPGDVVIADNLAAHKSPRAERLIRARGAWMLFLPPYSPDLNPIEMAFAKLKAHLRKRAVRTITDLWQAIGQICDLYQTDECLNYFKAAGYDPV